MTDEHQIKAAVVVTCKDYTFFYLVMSWLEHQWVVRNLIMHDILLLKLVHGEFSPFRGL